MYGGKVGSTFKTVQIFFLSFSLSGLYIVWLCVFVSSALEKWLTMLTLVIVWSNQYCSMVYVFRICYHRTAIQQQQQYLVYRTDKKRINSSILRFNDDHDDNVIDYSINIGFELKTVLNMDTHRLTINERFVDYNFEAYAHTHTQYCRRALHTNFRMKTRKKIYKKYVQILYGF